MRFTEVFLEKNLFRSLSVTSLIIFWSFGSDESFLNAFGNDLRIFRPCVTFKGYLPLHFHRLFRPEKFGNLKKYFWLEKYYLLKNQSTRSFKDSTSKQIFRYVCNCTFFPTIQWKFLKVGLNDFNKFLQSFFTQMCFCLRNDIRILWLGSEKQQNFARIWPNKTGTSEVGDISKAQKAQFSKYA